MTPKCFNEANVAASGITFTIDAASVYTANDQRDAALRGADWLDAEHNPKIVFVSSSVKRLDDLHYVIAGVLTIRGKSLPVDFRATLTHVIVNPFLNVPALGITATCTVKRSDFGMTKFLPAVGDDVELELQTELNQKP